MTQPLAPQIRATPGSPSSVRVGTVTSASPIAVSVQGAVFQSSAIGIAAGYVPQAGDVVCMLGQSSEAGSDPASWLVLGPVRGGGVTSEWLPLGSAVAPFATNWSNVGGGFRAGAYRLTADGCVELAGLLQFAATIAAPANMFSLPLGFRPIGGQVQPFATVSNNPAAAVAPSPRGISVMTSGLVQVTHYAGVINPGPISLDGIRFPVTTL